MEPAVDQQKQITIVVDAFSTSDYQAGPCYAAFTVDTMFIDRLKEVQNGIRSLKLSEAAIFAKPDKWGPGEVEDELRLQCGKLHLNKYGDFYFEDLPKYGEPIQSRGIDVITIGEKFAAARHGEVIHVGDDPTVLEMYLDDLQREQEEPQGQEDYIRVEYDLVYNGGGGPYEVALIPLSLVERMAQQHGGDGVDTAFTEVTKLDYAHIAHYSLNDLYDAQGQITQSMAKGPRSAPRC